MILIELHYEHEYEYNYEYEYTYEYEYKYEYEYEFMYNAYEYKFNFFTSATNLERDSSNSQQWNSVTHTLWPLTSYSHTGVMVPPMPPRSRCVPIWTAATTCRNTRTRR